MILWSSGMRGSFDRGDIDSLYFNRFKNRAEKSYLQKVFSRTRIKLISHPVQERGMNLEAGTRTYLPTYQLSSKHGINSIGSTDLPLRVTIADFLHRGVG